MPRDCGLVSGFRVTALSCTGPRIKERKRSCEGLGGPLKDKLQYVGSNEEKLVLSCFAWAVSCFDFSLYQEAGRVFFAFAC